MNDVPSIKRPHFYVAVCKWLWERFDKVEDEDLKYLPTTAAFAVSTCPEKHSLFKLRKWTKGESSTSIADEDKVRIRKFIRHLIYVRLFYWLVAGLAVSTSVAAGLYFLRPDDGWLKTKHPIKRESSSFKDDENPNEIWFSQPCFFPYEFHTKNASGEMGLAICFEIEVESATVGNINIYGKVQRIVDNLFQKFSFATPSARVGSLWDLDEVSQATVFGRLPPCPVDMPEVKVREETYFATSLEDLASTNARHFVVCLPLRAKTNCNLKKELKQLQETGPIEIKESYDRLSR